MSCLPVVVVMICWVIRVVVGSFSIVVVVNISLVAIILVDLFKALSVSTDLFSSLCSFSGFSTDEKDSEAWVRIVRSNRFNPSAGFISLKNKANASRMDVATIRQTVEHNEHNSEREITSCQIYFGGIFLFRLPMWTLQKFRRRNEFRTVIPMICLSSRITQQFRRQNEWRPIALATHPSNRIIPLFRKSISWRPVCLMRFSIRKYHYCCVLWLRGRCNKFLDPIALFAANSVAHR